MRRLPRSFWLFLVAAVAFGAAGLIADDTLSRSLFMVASVANLVVAFLQLRTPSRDREALRAARDQERAHARDAAGETDADGSAGRTGDR